MRWLIGALLWAALTPGLALSEVTPEGAVEALQREDLPGAQSQHEALLEAHGPQADVYYNLGLIHAAKGDHALASLQFERVLALMPGSKDALEQLERSREALYQVQLDERREVTRGEPEAMSQWRFYRQVDAGLIAWLLVAAWSLAFGALAWRRRLQGSTRDIALISAGVLLVASVGLGWYLMGYQSTDEVRPAIVVSEAPWLRSGPSDRAPTERPDDLYRGALVLVEDARGPWLEVSLMDGTRGWVSRDVISEIRVDRQP